MTTKSYLNQAIVSHFIELKADSDPDREILVFENSGYPEERLTYSEIHEKSNRIARAFLNAGIGKGDVYAVFMRNHAEFVLSMLAGPVIGAVMVPVDPRSRGDRLRFLLTHSKASAVVVSADFLPWLEQVLPQTPLIKTVFVVKKPWQPMPESLDWPTLNEILENDSWESVPQAVMDVRHPMQIIYTSGTTGDPKGVMIRNNRFGMFTIVTRLVWKYRPSDILYTGLSLTHGNAQAVTLFPALATGIPAVISAKFTKTRIWDICRKYGCTTFSLLGGMMAGIFNEPFQDNDADNSVKVVVSAGTPLAIWKDFEKRFDLKILEWYGAVEGGFAFKPPGKGPVGSFGKPLPGMMEFRVVDNDDRSVQPGTPGELIIKMIKGETRVDYLGNTEASREKTRGGWLRTGDMIVQDENGWFFFKSRIGSELRRSGDFIQPDRIERIIGEHPDVSEVCVYGIEAASGAPGESDLVAAVTPFKNRTIDPALIFEKCRKELEPNCVPSFLQIMDKIPKTISEKALDRVLKQMFSPEADNVFSLTDYQFSFTKEPQ
ncbi:MAG: acyl--CoA ligase [Deltaproteobacteria bacterium]|nr:acyl--CoA ligase [Deltaproteobacteria bacterium]